MNPDPRGIVAGTAELGRGVEPGSSDEEALFSGIGAILERGILIDTSNNYTDGRSESIIGEALRRVGKHHIAGVITKVDRHPQTGIFDRNRVLRSFEESTKRLGVERIPLLHLHDPLTVSFEKAMASGGAVEALLELREAGLVERLGVATGPTPILGQYVDTGLFDAVLCHSRYNLVDRSAEGIFTKARARGMTVFNAAPFGSGALARGPRPGARFAYLPLTTPLRNWLSAVEGLCCDHSVPLRAVALQFSLCSDLVDHTIVRATSPERLSDLERLAETPVPEQLWRDIDALGVAPTTIDDKDPRRIKLYLEQIRPEDYWSS